MKKIVLLTTALFLTFLVGCNEDDSSLSGQGPNSTIVGFTESSVSKSFPTSVQSASLELPMLSLLSYANDKLPKEDVVIEWEIIDPKTLGLKPKELAEYALPGVEYDAAATSGVATIVAGQTLASSPISINIIPTKLVLGTNKKIVVLLKSASNAIVGYNYSSVTVTLVPACPSSLAGKYKYENNVFNIVELEFGKYRSEYFPGLNVIPWFEFSDVCNKLEIFNFQYQSSNPLTSAAGGNPKGVVNEDGSITFFTVKVGGVASYNKTFTFTRN